MIIKTTLTPESIRAYNAIMERAHEDVYEVGGDCFNDGIENADREVIVDKDYLLGEAKWVVTKWEDFLFCSWESDWNVHYKHGDRSKTAVECHKQVTDLMKQKAAFKRAMKRWADATTDGEIRETEADEYYI